MSAKDLLSTHRLPIHFVRSDLCCSNICSGRCVNSQQFSSRINNQYLLYCTCGKVVSGVNVYLWYVLYVHAFSHSEHTDLCHNYWKLAFFPETLNTDGLITDNLLLFPTWNKTTSIAFCFTPRKNQHLNQHVTGLILIHWRDFQKRNYFKSINILDTSICSIIPYSRPPWVISLRLTFYIS